MVKVAPNVGHNDKSGATTWGIMLKVVPNVIKIK
jgi:hypothetical protein